MEMKRIIAGLAFATLGSMAFLTACDLEGTGCQIDADCFESEICYENTCREVCESDTDCLLGETCEPARGTMVCLPENTGGATCTFDTDCELDEACFDNTCTPTCTDDLDCSGDFECREMEGSSSMEKVCQAPDGEAPECEINEDCPNFAEGEICLDGACFLPGVEYYTVRVVDRTTGDRCSDTTYGYDTPGAKLMYVALIDGEGAVVSYAEAIDFLPGDPAAFFGDAFAIADGQPPAFDGQCPNEETFTRNNSTTEVTSNFHEDAVFAMGCGGELFAQFKDGEGQLIAIPEGFQIEVNAYGQTCNAESSTPAQSVEDPYDLEICSDRSSADTDISTCVVQNSAPMQGRTFTDVRFGE